MANVEQLELLKSGVEAWNKWREENPGEEIDFSGANLAGAILFRADLSGADLSGADLSGINLSKANLSEACLREAYLNGFDFSGFNLSWTNLNKAKLMETNLSGADLSRADLSGANLSKADLSWANLNKADLRMADLSEACLREADLSWADLSSANLSNADLSEAYLSNATLISANIVGTKVDGADISSSKIYGVNVWDLEGEFKEQNQLVISKSGQPEITVDNIKVAQFVYLILNNAEIRGVLNTLTTKSVLILGRFGLPERKIILDSLRNKLREYDLLPIVFDFERADDKDFTETVKTIAGLCYFVIADVTNPKSAPMELQATVPDYQIPFVPIIQEGEEPFSMMANLQTKYGWVLDTISYKDGDQLIRILKKGIIDRAMQKHDELRLIKVQIPTVISASQFEGD